MADRYVAKQHEPSGLWWVWDTSNDTIAAAHSDKQAVEERARFLNANILSKEADHG